MNANKSISHKADELEFQQMQELGDLMIYKSQIHKLAEGKWSEKTNFNLGPLKPSLMGEDPRLPKMPEHPTLIDFFNSDLRLPSNTYYKVQHLHRKTAYQKKWC